MVFEVGFLPQYIDNQRTYELYLLACANVGSPVQRVGSRVPYYTRTRSGGSWRWAAEDDRLAWRGDGGRGEGMAVGGRRGLPDAASVSRVASWRGSVCGTGGSGVSNEGLRRGRAEVRSSDSGGGATQGSGGAVDSVTGSGPGVVSRDEVGECASGGSSGDSGQEGISLVVRGSNWERNRAAREKKKRQKQKKGMQGASASAGAGCSVAAGDEHCASVSGAGLHKQGSEGFWNSCSADVRQRLIDSKAEMHIAENLRKVKKAEEEVKQMESPEALLVRAMAMVSMAEKCAKKKNDSKVAGWAETVATSYAESIAKSAPSSVPSYASVLSGSSATSVSVDGTKRKKPQALGLPRKSYRGDPQNPSYTYYEKRIGCTNNPIGLEKILDELQENTALADIDRTVLLSKCYDKKQRHGGVEVFA